MLNRLGTKDSFTLEPSPWHLLLFLKLNLIVNEETFKISKISMGENTLQFKGGSFWELLLIVQKTKKSKFSANFEKWSV